jgi:SAM-dependent methyltransferase
MTTPKALSGAQPLPSVVQGPDRTREFYRTHAAEYAAITLRMSMDPAADAFAAAVRPGGRVLDLGCGAGRDLRALAERGLRPLGLDYSETLAAHARTYASCPVVIADLRWLPFGEGTFDGVWAAASLLHLSRSEVTPALHGVRRVLRDGGFLFASVKAGRGEGPDDAGRWFTYYADDEWLQIIRDAGFAQVQVQERPSVPRGSSELPQRHRRVRWVAALAKAC